MAVLKKVRPAKSPRQSDERRKMMMQAGKILKELRLREALYWKDDSEHSRTFGELKPLTHQKLASNIGIDHYTMISQIEGGTMRIPARWTGAYAKALKVDKNLLAQMLLSYYEPQLYQDSWGLKAVNDARNIRKILKG